MIIFDFSQLLHFSLHSSMKLTGSKEPDINTMRIIILNKIQYFRGKFKSEYGEETIIAVDNKTWRKEVFPNYKFKRKKNRDEDLMDWKEIHKIFTTIKEEIIENLPYKVIDVTGAEGDDVIFILTLAYKNEPILILSVDKDFEQLHINENVKQYNPSFDKSVDYDRSAIVYNLFSHIAHGDSSDGISSIISDSDCFVNAVRQKPLKTAYIQQAFEEAKKGNLEKFLGTKRFARFQENKTLIDCRCVPEFVKTKILEAYSKYEVKPNNIYNYLVDKNLTKQFFQEIRNF